MRSAVLVLTLFLVGCCGCPPTCDPCAAALPAEAPTPPPPAPEASPDVEVAGGESPEPSAALGLLHEADGVFRSRKYEESRPVYERALAAARTAGDRRVVVEALAQIARTHSIAKEAAEGRRWLEEAGEMASADEPHGWTRYLGVRGIFEREAGQRKEAVATFKQMYGYAMAKGLFKQALSAAHHVAIAAEPEVQIAWGKKGIIAAAAMENDGWLAVLWNNLGATYEDLKRYPDALDAYKRARTYHHKGPKELPKMIADWAVGHAHRLVGNAGEATRWMQETLSWAERIYEQDPKRAAEWLGYCLEELGLLAQADGRHERALELFRQARSRFVEGGMEKHWPEHLAELDQRIRELESE